MATVRYTAQIAGVLAATTVALGACGMHAALQSNKAGATTPARATVTTVWKTTRRQAKPATVDSTTGTEPVTKETRPPTFPTCHLKRAPTMLTSASSVPTMLPAGPSNTASQIPWSRVGPGWTLALTNSASKNKSGIESLVMVNQSGSRYVVDHWAGNAYCWDSLVAWSPAMRQALVTIGGFPTGVAQQVLEISLTTGTAVLTYLPSNEIVQAYAPGTTDGAFVDQRLYGSSDGAAIEIRGAHGTLERTVAEGPGATYVAAEADGTFLVNVNNQVLLVSASGQAVGLGNGMKCNALRFWSATEVLASCPEANWAPRLWLLPASGTAGVALVPALSTVEGATGNNPWAGLVANDLNAFQTPSGLYLQVAGACAVVFIAKQEPGAHVKYVHVPGLSAGASTILVTALGDELEVEAVANGCAPPPRLLWFNPKTGKVQTILQMGSGDADMSFEPYPSLTTEPRV